MTDAVFAIQNGAGWRELPVGKDIVVDDVATAYASLLLWTPQYRTSKGIKAIEGMMIPEGKSPVGKPRIESRSGKPVRVWDLEDAPVLVVTSEMVDAERDRRIDAGFSFGGKRFQSRAKDRENILGAASLAHMALTLRDKQPGDLRWHGLETDFVWIAEDNDLVPMDAITVIGFGNAAAMHKSDHTFAARALKDALPVANITADEHWPAV